MTERRSETFRARLQGSFRERLVYVRREGEVFIVTDAGQGKEVDRFIGPVSLGPHPNGTAFRGGGKTFVLEQDDVLIAEDMLRIHQGELSEAVASGLLGGCPPGVTRWQYAILDIGILYSRERMQHVLAQAGSQGWDLATSMDKASNWFAGMEKGFLLLKRPVPQGIEPGSWCVTVRA